MSVVDGMLQMIVEQNARGLRLAAGAPARVIDSSGTSHKASSQELTRQEILQLVGPIVPEQARRRLPQESIVDFDYVSPSGPFKVTILRNGSEIAVNFEPDMEAVAASPPAPAVPAAPLVPGEEAPPPPPPTPSVILRGHPIDRLFRVLWASQGSDLHLSAGMPPLMRKDGQIQVLEADAEALGGDEITKLLDPIVPPAKRDELASRHDVTFAYEVTGLGRFRAKVFADRKGRGAVFRFIPALMISAEELNLSPYVLRLCTLQKGLVIVTGPTGSGKSTTLTALVDYINRTRTDHVITIEDPIEFLHESKGCLINQREVGTHTDGVTDAMRAALREDPNIVMVGDLCDAATARLALQTVESGHLVLATMPMATAATAVGRVIDQFPEEQQPHIRLLLSETLRGVIAQTLCRRAGGGRVAAFEVLLVNSAIANLVREGKTFQIPSMIQASRAQGMIGQGDALLELVVNKMVDAEEAYATAADKAGFEALLKRANIETTFVPVA
ncbi:MAG TPA: PilT/PilU family type 4a pilus ATPase [Vicinamibacterales bacterium]|nr:PilT/PilU family type 4a pilus ATPase [Vicinamibacterales bacterium]